MAVDHNLAHKLGNVMSESVERWIKDNAGGEVEANAMVSALITYAGSIIHQCPDPEQRLRFMSNAIVALVGIVDANAVVSVHSTPEAMKAVLDQAMGHALAGAKPAGSA